MTSPTNQRLYADNAATSFPKPVEVTQAMVHYATAIGASAGRGAYHEAHESGRVLHDCRDKLNRLFHGEHPDHFIFTLNCSDALNLAIQGWLNPGDHIITTAMDHNSVLRPINELATRYGVRQTRVPVHPDTCLVEPDDITKAITPKTRMIAVCHGSNVTGTLQPIHHIGEIARRHGVAFLVDAAQTAGHVPINLQHDAIDFLAFPGHKGLMGPLGTGCLYIRPGLETQLRTVRQGGTGSISEQDTQPTFMPDRFEPGSHNAIGIAGLSAALDWIGAKGIEALYRHQQALSTEFCRQAREIEALTFFGPQDARNRVAVFSIRIAGWDPVDLALALERTFGILTRPGLHCAPWAHRTLKTHVPPADCGARAAGTTRLSFGAFNTLEDIARCTTALEMLAQQKSLKPIGAA